MTRTRLLLGVLAVALLIAGGVTGGPYIWRWVQYVRHERTAAARRPAAITAWRQTYGDPRARAAQFTRASDNPTAARLVTLATPLGIALESRSHASPKFPEANAIGRYVNTAGDPTEPSVRAYLDAHRSDIASIVDWLTTTEQPRWKSTVSPPLPLPESAVSILAVRWLNNVLAAHALLEASEGHADEADRAMRAAWQVMRSARDQQPHMIGYLMSIALTEVDLRAVRQAADSGAWRDRLDEYDYAAGLKRSIEMEVVEHILIDDGSLSRRAFLADYIDGMRANLERLHIVRLTDPPGTSPSFDSPAYEQSIAPGTIVAEIAWPGLRRAYQEALCTNLDVELTKRVLEARQAKAGTGRWPERMPDVASAVVADARWMYATHANDMMSISLSRSTPACPASSRSFETRR
jgi:hypothetical protein